MKLSNQLVLTVSTAILINLTMFIAGNKACAQRNHLNDQIISRNWNVIGGVSFKVVNDKHMYAQYTKEIKRYANKTFELEGYMIPITAGMKQSKFMLSSLPVNQCFYCGKNGIPVMVFVELSEPAKFTYNTVKVKGVLKLSISDAMEYPPIVLVNGEVIP